MVVKKKSFVFIVFILFIFALLTYQGVKKENNLVPRLSLYPILVLEQGISFIVKKAENVFYTYIFIVGKEEENRVLSEQIKKYELERNQFIESRLENERLRKLLDLKSRRVDYVTSAEVFARDPTNWFQSLWISKGETDGISKDMIAISPLGVVGKVQRALKDSSNILLITNINSVVSVRIQSSRVEGILEGKGDNKCSLKYVPQDVQVSEGERVITSGLDGIYPEGLQVGYVTNVMKKAGEIFSVIEVAMMQDLNAIEEVIILKK
ncbi:rod shape-determining protein MreC [bacterium]|nr:MAG: rod shape-determining protein MreC [bacterium]